MRLRALFAEQNKGPRKAGGGNNSEHPTGHTHRHGGGLLDAYRRWTFVLGMLVTLLLSGYGAFALTRPPEPPSEELSSLTPTQVDARVVEVTKTPSAPSTVSSPREATAVLPQREPTAILPSMVTASPTKAQRASPTAGKKSTPVPLLEGTSTPQPTVTTAGELSEGPTPQGTPTPVATRIVGSRPVQPSPRYEPLPLRSNESLGNQIRNYLSEEVEGYGVVVKRLSDGVGVAINADQQFYAASLFKILVMFEVFKQRELELLSFDEPLTFTPPYIDYALGPPRWPVWSQVSVRDLLEAMITESDNVAAMMLHDRTGGWNIIADFKSIGLEHTDIAADDMPTSAGDMALWLEMIARGSAVNEKSSREMIDLLVRQKIDDRLPALLPTDVEVAHKTGNWENATHDVGVVYAPHGAYVIAILSDKAWEPKPIAELSRLVYEHFEGKNGR